MSIDMLLFGFPITVEPLNGGRSTQLYKASCCGRYCGFVSQNGIDIYRVLKYLNNGVTVILLVGSLGRALLFWTFSSLLNYRGKNVSIIWKYAEILVSTGFKMATVMPLFTFACVLLLYFSFRFSSSSSILTQTKIQIQHEIAGHGNKQPTLQLSAILHPFKTCQFISMTESSTNNYSNSIGDFVSEMQKEIAEVLYIFGASVQIRRFNPARNSSSNRNNSNRNGNMDRFRFPTGTGGHHLLKYQERICFIQIAIPASLKKSETHILSEPFTSEQVMEEIQNHQQDIFILITPHFKTTQCESHCEIQIKYKYIQETLCKFPLNYLWLFFTLEKDPAVQKNTLYSNNQISQHSPHFKFGLRVKLRCSPGEEICLIPLNSKYFETQQDQCNQEQLLAFRKIMQKFRTPRWNFHRSSVPVFYGPSKVDISLINPGLSPVNVDKSPNSRLPLIMLLFILGNRLNFTLKNEDILSKTNDGKCAHGYISVFSALLQHDRYNPVVMFGSRARLLFYGTNSDMDIPPSFYSLIQPFEWTVWVVFAITIFIFSVIFKLFGDAGGGGRGKLFSVSVQNVMLLTLPPFLNQIQIISINIQLFSKLRYIYTFWILLSVLLSTIFSSFLQSFRVAPAAIEVKKSFQDIIHEKYRIIIHEGGRSYFKYFLEPWERDYGADAGFVLKHKLLLNNSVEMKFPPESAEEFRQIFTRDRSSSLVVDDDPPVYSEILQRFFQRRSYVAKDKFFDCPLIAKFMLSNVDAPLHVFKWILNTGIFKYWWDMRLFIYKREEVRQLEALLQNEPEVQTLRVRMAQGMKMDDAQPISLNDSLIISAMYCFLVGNGLALICFVKEIFDFLY